MNSEKAGLSDVLAGKAELDFDGIVFLFLLLVLLLWPLWPILLDLFLA